MGRRSLHDCRIHKRARPNGRRSPDHALGKGKDDAEDAESVRDFRVQSRTISETGVDDVDDSPLTRNDTADFYQGHLLQELGGVVSIFHVEVLGISEGGENRVFLLLFESSPLGGLGTDNRDGARPRAGAVLLIQNGEELDS